MLNGFSLTFKDVYFVSNFFLSFVFLFFSVVDNIKPGPPIIFIDGGLETYPNGPIPSAEVTDVSTPLTYSVHLLISGRISFLLIAVVVAAGVVLSGVL